MTQEFSRRRFIAMALVAAATPVATSLAAPQSTATKAPAKKAATTGAKAAAPAAKTAAPALPKLSLNDPQAKALSYTEDATTTKNPVHKPGSDCANCMLYKGAPNQAYGPCTLFPKNSVAAKGWCAGWVKKA